MVEYDIYEAIDEVRQYGHHEWKLSHDASQWLIGLARAYDFINDRSCPCMGAAFETSLYGTGETRWIVFDPDPRIGWNEYMPGMKCWRCGFKFPMPCIGSFGRIPDMYLNIVYPTGVVNLDGWSLSTGVKVTVGIDGRSAWSAVDDPFSSECAGDSIHGNIVHLIDSLAADTGIARSELSTREINERANDIAHDFRGSLRDWAGLDGEEWAKRAGWSKPHHRPRERED